MPGARELHSASNPAAVPSVDALAATMVPACSVFTKSLTAACAACSSQISPIRVTFTLLSSTSNPWRWCCAEAPPRSTCTCTESARASSSTGSKLFQPPRSYATALSTPTQCLSWTRLACCCPSSLPDSFNLSRLVRNWKYTSVPTACKKSTINKNRCRSTDDLYLKLRMLPICIPEFHRLTRAGPEPNGMPNACFALLVKYA
mmetsp:Transcript_25990/g.49377  ORF Transcript_25990/g.49377 Transcript_25990/m.49377 type:complete len:203 (-) Transcript_25990:405-1013(-)